MYLALVIVRWEVGEGHVLNTCYSELISWWGDCIEPLLWCGERLGRGMYWTVVIVTGQVKEFHVLNLCYVKVTVWGGACTKLVFWWLDRLVSVMYWLERLWRRTYCTGLIVRWQDRDGHVQIYCYGDVNGWGRVCTELFLYSVEMLETGIYWTVLMLWWKVEEGHVLNSCYGDVTG
jgi:hypothetical protein